MIVTDQTTAQIQTSLDQKGFEIVRFDVRVQNKCIDLTGLFSRCNEERGYTIPLDSEGLVMLPGIREARKPVVADIPQRVAYALIEIAHFAHKVSVTIGKSALACHFQAARQSERSSLVTATQNISAFIPGPNGADVYALPSTALPEEPTRDLGTLTFIKRVQQGQAPSARAPFKSMVFVSRRAAVDISGEGLFMPLTL